MITKWKLFNFKSVRDETELELGPLTILAGPNSSGKSTWTQSMLLISQTLASKVSSRSVVLNGHLTKLGQFDDLRSFNSEADQILIGWECEPRASEDGRLIRNRIRNVSCAISFDVDPSSPDRDLMQLQPRLFTCDLSGSVRDENNVDEGFSLVVSHTGQEDEEVRRLGISKLSNLISPSSFGFDVELDPNSLKELLKEHSTREPIGCELSHFLPGRIPMRIDKAQEEADEIVSVIFEEGFDTFLKHAIYRRLRRGAAHYRELSRYITKEAVVPIPQSVINLLRTYLGDLIRPLFEEVPHQLTLFSEETVPLLTTYDWYAGVQELSEEAQDKLRHTIQEHRDEIVSEINQAVRSERETPYEFEITTLPENLSVAANYLNSFFSSSIKYLGPLRDEPKPLYPLAATVDPHDIGLRGEYTAAVLDLHKDDLISYLPTTNFVEPTVNPRPTTRSLEAAVLDWLQYMGVAEKVETRDRGKLGHELKVTTSDSEKPQDLTHVGVGVSQVLPILVMCLLADKDTTLIIEQPELHLHPKVQTLLADFFLSMALLGKQCIIETHSEYIINRLRFRAASAAGDALSSKMKIYFVEKKEGTSSFRDVVVNKYGAITDWPEGFFDQSQDEAEEILRAATLKRKKERGAT